MNPLAMLLSGGASGFGGGGGSNPISNIFNKPPVGGSTGYTAFGGGGSGSGYNHFLDPERGGIGSLIGKLTGAPSKDEFIGRKRGTAYAGLMGFIQQGQQQGKTVQQSTVEYIQTPEGLELMMDKDAMQNLGPFLQSLQTEQVSPGTGIRNQLDGTVDIPVPPTSTQELTNLLGGAGLNDEQEQLVYRSILAAQTATNTSEDDRLYADAERMGMMSHEQAVFIRTHKDRFVQVPITNANKEVIGVRIQDVLGEQEPIEWKTNTGQLGILSPPQVGGTLGNQAQAGPALAPDGSALGPEGAPQTGAPGSGSFGIDPANEAGGDIVEGAGIANTIEAGFGRLWGQVFTDYTGADATARQQAFEQIRYDMAGMATGRLKGLFDKLDKITNTHGLNTNVEVLAQQMIDLRKDGEALAARMAARSGNLHISEKSRNEAEQDYFAIEDGLRNVPSIVSMEAAIEQYKANPLGSVPQLIDQASEAAPQASADVERLTQDTPAIEFDPQETPPAGSFADEAALQEAIRAGSVAAGNFVELGTGAYVQVTQEYYDRYKPAPGKPGSGGGY